MLGNNGISQSPFSLRYPVVMTLLFITICRMYVETGAVVITHFNNGDEGSILDFVENEDVLCYPR